MMKPQLPGYYVIIHFLGIIVLVPWVLRSQEYGDLVKDLALNKVWWYELLGP
jgi:hypothetical protein